VTQAHGCLTGEVRITALGGRQIYCFLTCFVIAIFCFGSVWFSAAQAPSTKLRLLTQ
jgi:hypothetical protein